MYIFLFSHTDREMSSPNSHPEKSVLTPWVKVLFECNVDVSTLTVVVTGQQPGSGTTREIR